MFILSTFISLTFIVIIISALIAIIFKDYKNSLKYIAAIDLTIILNMSIVLFNSFYIHFILLVFPYIGWIFYFMYILYKRLKNTTHFILFGFLTIFILILIIASIFPANV